MKRLLYAAGLFTALGCFVQAQTATARADVPFGFRMGSSTMPAGTYVVQQLGAVLIIREEGGTNKSAIQLTLPTARAAASSQPKLEFHRYGSDYFLAAVWNPNSHEGRALPKSKAEQELSRHIELLQTASISLR
jgi:hypothetical protein